jgi:hypothetical protein
VPYTEPCTPLNYHDHTEGSLSTAYSPVIRQGDLPTTITVPWWADRTLHYEFA